MDNDDLDSDDLDIDDIDIDDLDIDELAGRLTAGIVLTHRLSQFEQEHGYVNLTVDLAGFNNVRTPTRADGSALGIDDRHPAETVWVGSPDWFEAFQPGDLIAMRVDPKGVVSIEGLDTAPAVDGALVASLRAVYDAEAEETQLPTASEDLLLAVLVEQPHAFDAPQAPLSDLYEAAGLEHRDGMLGDGDLVWHFQAMFGRHRRAIEAFGENEDAVSRLLWVLEITDLAAGLDPEVTDVEEPYSPELVREVLDELRDEEFLSVFATALFDSPERDAHTRAVAFVAAALGAAKRPAEVAVAQLLAVLLAEKDLEPLVAEQHLVLAHEADPESAIVTDRLAWYASDRGDAATAARLWRQLERSPGLALDLAAVERFDRPRAIEPGRNEPCWCGSGRKYKQCHLGSTETPPLPDRITWLWRKAVAYVEREGYEAQEDILDISFASATDPTSRESLLETFDDPLVLDLALVEAGWFEQFIEARGALLPEDEAELVRSWEPIVRTVYEVVEVQRGSGLDVRDLRTGAELTVRDGSTSESVEAHDLLCARAVPDGETNQFVGAVIPVSKGAHEDLLETLEVGDPEMTAEWFAELRRRDT